MSERAPLHRLEVGALPSLHDPLADATLARLRQALPTGSITGVMRVEVTTLAARLDPRELAVVAALLAQPVSQHARVDGPLHVDGFDVALEIGFLAGVTDNVAATIAQMVGAALRPLADDEGVFTSRLYLLRGALSDDELHAVALALSNPLIERATHKRLERYGAEHGMDRTAPFVTLTPHPRADLVDLDVDDEELARIGKEGVPEAAGARGAGIARRGPLALDLPSMRTIRVFFRDQLRRTPTDVELESIAQNWSEHCRHLFFNTPIDGITEGLFKRYIRGATETIRAARGDDDPCVSVFSDNAGAIAFDAHWLVTDKVETHNSPSALDPFGGALTGILGVNRDALGFGLGAKPILNRYGFCLPWPSDDRQLFRGRDAATGRGTEPLLDPVRLADGVIAGVEVGGNCSGIPTPQGFLAFHAGFRAKPLVFVGTLGFLPREEGGRKLHEKAAQPGDRVVVLGGRVGKDGIHGATFSSEALASGSPATAVQIGAPITQKLFSDALVREARGRGLYRSLTDNGAGGLSCSVTEMARESGGCDVDLRRVPLKYPGMAPWEVWVSESQERMTLAVPPEHTAELLALFAARDVEATDLGVFTDSGRAVVRSGDLVVMDLPLDFLHDGWPRQQLRTRAPDRPPPSTLPLPAVDAGDALLRLLRRPGLSSHEDVVRRFDHEVQGTSVLKPLCGPGQVCADVTAVRPLLDSPRAVAVSQALAPALSELDPYAMATWCVDTAVRRLIAAGAALPGVALLDNFCWSSPADPVRLWQLEAACRACHDVAVAYGTPFISGKDSMHNDFRGHDAGGAEVRLSVPPTLLISSLAVVPDVARLVTLDLKQSSDVVFLLGSTSAALGGSALCELLEHEGGAVPGLDVPVAERAYRAFAELTANHRVTAAIALGHGGLALAAARMALAGGLGLQLDTRPVREARACEDGLAGQPLAEAALLFAETPGRILFTVAPADAERVVDKLSGASVPLARLGEVTREERLRLGDTLDVELAALERAYHTPWRQA